LCVFEQLILISAGKVSGVPIRLLYMTRVYKISHFAGLFNEIKFCLIFLEVQGALISLPNRASTTINV
jgi:hypothetical protein